MGGVGDKPLLLAHVFLRAFQQAVDGGNEAGDFAGNVVGSERREVVVLPLPQASRQFFDGAHGAVGNPYGQCDRQRNGEQQRQGAAPCGVFSQVFAVFAFLYDGYLPLAGPVQVGAVVVVVVGQVVEAV